MSKAHECDGYEFYSCKPSTKCMHEDCSAYALVDVFAARRGERMSFCLAHVKHYFPNIPPIASVQQSFEGVVATGNISMGCRIENPICSLCAKEYK